MNTLLLDRTAWDLVLDTHGNIALASDPYSIAQDVCSAVRLFLGELWYDTTRGIPYYGQILGESPALEFIKTQVVEAALAVPQVMSAECLITEYAGRQMRGQVQFTYTTQTAGASTNSDNSAIVTFIGDNTKIVVFVGDSGFPITFIGS